MPKAEKARFDTETIDLLNIELHGLRALRRESSIGIHLLFSLAKDINGGFNTSEERGKAVRGAPSKAKKLKEAADAVPDLYKDRARFGRTCVSFAERTEVLMTTRTNDERIRGNLRLLRPKEYYGDPDDLPGLYVTGATVSHSGGTSIEGRVLSVQHDLKDSGVGAWVWRKGDKEWTSGVFSGPHHVRLLDPDVVLVDFLPNCTLPKPGSYRPHPEAGLMD